MGYIPPDTLGRYITVVDYEVSYTIEIYRRYLKIPIYKMPLRFQKDAIVEAVNLHSEDPNVRDVLWFGGQPLRRVRT